MAALEKIRQKAVLLTVAIGVALLAFILGDAERVVSSVFGNNSTIAKVDGEKSMQSNSKTAMNLRASNFKTKVNRWMQH